MLFKESRGNDGLRAESVEFSEVILSPIASFGGIYCPDNLPEFDQAFLESQVPESYKSLALAMTTPGDTTMATLAEGQWSPPITRDFQTEKGSKKAVFRILSPAKV